MDQSSGANVSRRRLLFGLGSVLAAGAASSLLAACGTPPAPPAAAPPATTAPAPAAAVASSPVPTPKPAASPSAAAAASAVPSPSAVAAPTAAPAVASGGKVIRAAFVYTGPINDHGWTNAHDDGRKALEQALGSSVETAFTENVPETADSQRVFEDYARKGYDVIYAEVPNGRHSQESWRQGLPAAIARLAGSEPR